MARKRVLIIPDAYFANDSGAFVAQIAKRLLQELECVVAIFTPEVKDDYAEDDGTKIYHRIPYKLSANWITSTYVDNFNKVLDNFKPDVIYTLGSITNKNVCYFTIARKRRIKVIAKIFMQDFFCAKFYANNENGVCTKCLDRSQFCSLTNHCIKNRGNKVVSYIRQINYIIVRKRLQSELKHVHAVITSTQEQIDFYQRFGIPANKCFITPLYFNGDKLKKYNSTIGDYFVFIAQNRIEKGIHLLGGILKYCNPPIKIIAAFWKKEAADWVIQKYDLQQYIDNGVLEVKSNCTWNTNLGEVVAASRGVLIPSIWPTTTEYGLLEALGLKKPVFTFEVGVHAERIVNGINGYKAPIAKGELVAQQMAELYNDDELYYKVSEGAYQLYQELTDWDGWKSLLDRLINS